MPKMIDGFLVQHHQMLFIVNPIYDDCQSACLSQQVHDKFDLMSETLFLTVNLIDRFLSKQTVVRKKLQLVGLVAMLLACKYEEVSVPVVGDLILISDKAYTRKEVLEMVIPLFMIFLIESELACTPYI